MLYPKINSLWKRHGWNMTEQEKKLPGAQRDWQKFIEGDYACPEFASINKWRVEEKIDGTNIRFIFNPAGTYDIREMKAYPVSKIEFAGRTGKSILSKEMMKFLRDTFEDKIMLEEAIFAGNTQYIAILYGELYGGNIQSAGPLYSDNYQFCLFDVAIHKPNRGWWWLLREDVYEIAKRLNVNHAPDLGIMDTQTAVEYVKCNPLSDISFSQQTTEGIICRSEPQMMFRDTLSPIMWKLKCKDFKDKYAME